MISMKPSNMMNLRKEGECTAISAHRSWFVNSDFDDHHDSPKEEVNRNYFVHYSDISDIFKDFVDNNGVSSCLKSLWKTRL